RHTSFSRDWSSDVCSSDLVGADDQAAPGVAGIDPDDRVVGGVAKTGDGGGLRTGEYAGDSGGRGGGDRRGQRQGGVPVAVAVLVEEREHQAVPPPCQGQGLG